jgi:hypothetical protein
MIRCVDTELLDELPPTDPGAIGSRRDLRKLNAWMSNASTIARALRRSYGHVGRRRLIELGAGDGFQMLKLLRLLGAGWRSRTVVLVDRLNVVEPEARRQIESLGWEVETHTEDVLDWLRPSAPDASEAIISNLFLHQFSESRLARILAGIATRANVFVAAEPHRSEWSLMFSRMTWLIGCNQVTRHDAPVSVRAGFVGNELSKLWPGDSDWILEERRAGLFGHVFVAQRKAFLQ